MGGEICRFVSRRIFEHCMEQRAETRAERRALRNAKREKLRSAEREAANFQAVPPLRNFLPQRAKLCNPLCPLFNAPRCLLTAVARLFEKKQLGEGVVPDVREAIPDFRLTLRQRLVYGSQQ